LILAINQQGPNTRFSDYLLNCGEEKIKWKKDGWSKNPIISGGNCLGNGSILYIQSANWYMAQTTI